MQDFNAGCVGAQRAAPKNDNLDQERSTLVAVHNSVVRLACRMFI